MGPLLGLDFNTEVFGPGLVLGVANAGLYGLLAISLVLTYRVSRTIGFVQGGIAMFSTYFYWWLTVDTGATVIIPGVGGEPRMDKLPGLLVCVGVGALIGLVYGFTVTGKRLANWPRINLTTYSLAWLLLIAGVNFSLFQAQDQRLPSVFGDGSHEVMGGYITNHQIANLVILFGLVVALGFVLVRTQTGIYIRAIADDVEASRFVGISLNGVGTGVYAFSGALSAFAGVLLGTTLGTGLFAVLVVFLRSLTVSVLGGMTSFALALAGCFLLAIGESSMQAGLFGTIDPGVREGVIMAVLFGLVLVINRIRPIRVVEAAGL